MQRLYDKLQDSAITFLTDKICLLGIATRSEYIANNYCEQCSKQNIHSKFIRYLHKDSFSVRAGPEVIKLFPCSTLLSTKFIQLMNVKMPTIVGILTFSMINTTSERLKARSVFISRYFSFWELLKFFAQLS